MINNNGTELEETLSPAQERFLEAFSQTGRISSAAKAAGITPASHYKWKQNPIYKKWFQAARMVVGDNAEEAAIDRSINGSEDVVIHQGRPVEVFCDRATGEIVPDTIVEADKQAGVNLLEKYHCRILTRREYHDTLHALILKGLKPEVYRDRLDVTADVATTLEIVVKPSNV